MRGGGGGMRRGVGERVVVVRRGEREGKEEGEG